MMKTNQGQCNRAIMAFALLGALLSRPPARANETNTVVPAGSSSNVVFTVGATGTAPFSYQWNMGPASDTNVPTTIRAQFFKLCDLAAIKVRDEHNKVPFFVDSYAVRALCSAYDLTGATNYLNACRDWSERMVEYQEKMIPSGAYYMHYNRKPGERTNDWYAADSGSIGMGVLATAIRCDGAEKKRYLKSAEHFANLVLKNYAKPSGGISDGLWHQSSDEWWCSSGIDGSFLFNLYATTGTKRYLKAALHVTDWLNQLDLEKPQPFPLSQQGPAMIFYVMENYSAGWPYIVEDDARKKAAEAKVAWCLNWIAEQEKKSPAERQWPPTAGWGMKAGGLPFHQYVFSTRLMSGGNLKVVADAELERLAEIVFDGEPKATQLSMFILMSYAERENPEGIYRAR